MRDTKPTLMFIEDLIEAIDNSINELDSIFENDLKSNPDYVLKGQSSGILGSRMLCRFYLIILI